MGQGASCGLSYSSSPLSTGAPPRRCTRRLWSWRRRTELKPGPPQSFALQNVQEVIKPQRFGVKEAKEVDGEGVRFFLRAGFLSSFYSGDQAVAVVEFRREGSRGSRAFV
nr:hypothetical protein CFP56_02308 [Quercus suber]